MRGQHLPLYPASSIWERVFYLVKPTAARSSFSQAVLTAGSLRDTASVLKSVAIMGKNGPLLLGGHRGMGENLMTRSPDGKTDVYPAFRENTIQSFQQAAKCGVGFVEFDVQVTSDNVPVIWHDDDVVIGPMEHPLRPHVKDLTLVQLQTLCGQGREGGAHTPGGANGLAPTASPLTRDSSNGKEEENTVEAVNGDHQSHGLLRLFRDKATRQRATSYQQWKCHQDDAIPTLEAVFAALPIEIGFDIEIKMTTGDDVVHTPSDEVERMLSAILAVVDRCSAPSAGITAPRPAPEPPSPLASAHVADGPADGTAAMPRRRQIIFSSFDPDVCVELRRRQVKHPVYYLSGCGLYTHADARRTSIPAALSFAAETGMRGIVVPASVLMKNMDMVESANRNHLELMTYGLENNDLDCLKAQADAGVVAAIVDEVAGVTAALNASSSDSPAASECYDVDKPANDDGVEVSSVTDK